MRARIQMSGNIVPILPFPLSGILVNGQSLSVGTTGVPVLSVAQPATNVQLHDSSGNYTNLASGTWSLIPLIAPERADKWLNNQSNTSQYPTNVNGESPDVVMANALVAMAGGRVLTSNCGQGGASYTVIGKGGSGNAYQSLLNEITVARLLDPTYGVALATLTHGETDWGVAFYDRWLLQYQQELETDAKAITGQSKGIPLVFNQQNSQPSAPQQVAYQSQLQAALSGESVIKTAVGTLFAYDSGAASSGTLTGDGYVETTIDNTAVVTGRVLGLNHGVKNNAYDTTWNYALFFNGNTSVQIYESGVLKGTFAANADGDVFRIEIAAGVVEYKKNGAIFYTSGNAPTYPLLVQTVANIQWAGLYRLKLSTGPLGPWTNITGSAIATDASSLLLSGPNYYFPFTDRLHLTASGYQQLGEQYARAAFRHFTTGWSAFAPTNATIVGNVVTVTFAVPDAPLVFDGVKVSPHLSGSLAAYWANGKGFEARDAGGNPIVITSVAIANGNQVLITCASPPETIAYAITPDLASGTAGGFPDGRCGLLRDSDTFVGPITGVAQANWCLAFSITGLASTGRWWFDVPPQASSFVPTDVGGCVLWLDAGQGLTLGTSWLDQSGSGDANKNMASTAWPTLNASDALYNNKPTLSFNGTTQYLASGAWAAPLAQPETFFIVGNFSGLLRNEYMADGGSANERVVFNNTDASAAAAYAGALLDGAGAPSASPVVIAVQFDGATSKIWISALTAAASGSSGGVTSRTGLTLASIFGHTSQFLQGKVAEVVDYNSILGGTDFASVMHYLGTKYGITIGA